jgi:hypothetical protein
MNERIEVKVAGGISGFAEDKDAAKELRKSTILPSLLAHDTVVLDFSGITSSTQSFVHALIAEPLQQFGESVLSRLEFRSCAPQIKSLVGLVVDYSLGGFSTTPSDPMDVGTRRPNKKRTSEKPVKVHRKRKSA